MNQINPAGTAVKIRDPWLDNAKGILIFLVVAGHAMATLTTRSEFIKSIYYVINATHMLAFMFITGYLGRKRIDRRDVPGVITRLFIPYLVFQVLFYLLLCGCTLLGADMTDGQSLGQLIWLRPIQQLWYLMAVILFNFAAMALPLKKYPRRILVISFFVSWAGLFLPEISYLRLTKSVGYWFPFLVGYYWKKEWMTALRDDRRLRLPALVIFGLWSAALVLWRNRIYSNIFFLATPYWKFPEEYKGWYGILSRPVFILTGLTAGFAFLVLVPRCKTVFTRLGQYSIYIFGLHNLPIWILRRVSQHVTPIYPRINSYPEYLLLLICICILTWTLASPPVVKLLKPLVEPRLDLSGLFRRITDPGDPVSPCNKEKYHDK